MEGMLSGAKLDFNTYDTVWEKGKGPTLESEYGDKKEKKLLLTTLPLVE